MSLSRFEGVSWSHDEEHIAYVAEEPLPSRPLFGQSLFSTGQSSKSEGEVDAGTWKGQGDWLEDWGESYSGKRRPVLFVASLGRYCVFEDGHWKAVRDELVGIFVEGLFGRRFRICCSKLIFLQCLMN